MTDKHRNEAISNALKRRIRKFSRIEKVFYGSIILTAITMAVSIIYLQSRNLQVQQEITNLNSQISDMQTDYDNAKQEVNELTSRDRIEQIAGNAGLTSQQDNIKQVE
ncbi:cell division protein FtsL [Streptococcus gallolyticus]|uniref:Cell division protein FtsL n=2 Tax=Streptococcus gallolyticus TaxID=315405 RepID=A0A060RGG8_9STRE|nr:MULTISPECIES: cell division protein FtsL [Streptococcus]MCF2566742.1 cell division protein FtsL [Streptococcus pasteurianus]AQP41463.1 cell division protein [Streptococcus gallolyticus subsp. gallolyticus DSM 16831]EFM30237.1 cell division protein FtsL [Streptococcus gallolyticus subsp. gallolyticus TX20005]KJF00271.1 cell division protein FtsL [Streptococcus gallolyticus subsp. gallolyticus]KXT66481.1 Cell division protein FtsL [Streptococcus gallolyticus]